MNLTQTQTFLILTAPWILHCTLYMYKHSLSDCLQLNTIQTDKW